MRSTALALALALVGACGSNPTPTTGTPQPSETIVNVSAGIPIEAEISCQPLGYPEALVHFSFISGPIDQAGAEARARALSDACAAPQESGGPTAHVATTTVTSKADTGGLGGPNRGQAVWAVQIDLEIADSPAHSYMRIEVNQRTGVPTVMALG
jgi:hypothetical protein